jgi:hypothetical protein
MLENITQKFVFIGIWLALTIYAFIIAPPVDPNTQELIVNLSIGRWQEINSLIVALFNLMGIWPIIYTSILLFDGRGQKIPAWPFVVASFGVGAFALLPYLALRQPNPEFTGEKSWLLKILDSRWLALSVALGALALVAYGLIGGDWADFANEWYSSKFINVMSLDFCLLCLLFPFVMQDDSERRQISDNSWFHWIVWVPLLGALVYLLGRSPIIVKDSTSNEE